MGIIFRPAGQQFVQVADPEWQRNAWDTDECSILYRGPRTKVDAFMQSIDGKMFTSLQNFPTMWLNAYEKTNMTANFPGVYLKYVGFRSGNIPPVRRVNDLSSQQASGQGTDKAPSSPTYGKQLTGTFTYRASRTTWKWYERSTPPILPRYASVDQPIDPFQNLQNYTIQPVIGDDGLPLAVTYAAFVAVINSLSRQIVVSDYEREELVKNTLWACTSIVEYRIQSA